MIQKILIDQEGTRHYWSKGDLHTSFGVIKEKDILDGGTTSHLGKKFVCFGASMVDRLDKIKRGPATFTLKDVGEIIAHCGIGRDTKVVDAGTGTGTLALMLGRISENVISYERNKETFEIAKENAKMLDVKIEIKNKDITEGIDEKNVDVITLDLLNPENVLKHARKSLKSGGFLVAYLPNINQVQHFVLEAQKTNFIQESVVECIEREWIVEEKRLRPKNQMLGHTGFLVFLRRY